MAELEKKSNENSSDYVRGDKPNTERRDALKKMAVYSADTAPALLAFLKPAEAQIASLPFGAGFDAMDSEID